MAAHRANPSCAGCHATIDPIGFALENFDAVGRWREVDEDFAPIDASGTLPDGTAYSGLADFRAALLDTLNEGMFAGGAAKLSQTFSGMVSNLEDEWSRFKLQVADAGVFDNVKAAKLIPADTPFERAKFIDESYLQESRK